MATKKNFVTKRKKNGYEKLGDSLSDTEIEFRKNLEGGDGGSNKSLKSVNEKLPIGDGFTIPLPNSKNAFAHQMKVKDEMKIDLRQVPSTSLSKQSSFYKLYPIEEVSEKSSLSVRSKANSSQERLQRILEENRSRAQNRPMSANRRLKMDKDFEIRKPYITSEESELNSAFNEEATKIISASQNTLSETTISDSMSSFKQAHIQRLSHDSVQRYQSRLMRFNECSNQNNVSSYTDDDLLTIRTYSSTKCNTCCFGKFFNFRKYKKP